MNELQEYMKSFANIVNENPEVEFSEEAKKSDGAEAAGDETGAAEAGGEETGAGETGAAKAAGEETGDKETGATKAAGEEAGGEETGAAEASNENKNDNTKEANERDDNSEEIGSSKSSPHSPVKKRIVESQLSAQKRRKSLQSIGSSPPNSILERVSDEPSPVINVKRRNIHISDSESPVCSKHSKVL